MARTALLLAALSIIAGPGTPVVYAQQAAFPFPLPEPVLAVETDDLTGDTVATVGIGITDCAAHFTGIYTRTEELAPGYTISGYGTEPGPDNRRYVFGVLQAPNTLFQLDVSEADGHCVLRFGNQPWIIQTDEFRWSWAPLPLLNGETLDLDPLLQAP